LRREARENNVAVTVAKNRLVKLALASHDEYKDAETGVLTGQLALAIGDDEVAPAQALANFGKTHPALEIVGGLTREGKVLTADEVKALASLPSKDVLRGQVVGTIAAPLSGFVSVLNGNLRGLVNVLDARAKALQ
jgi:large subunit ribosomal protein L10